MSTFQELFDEHEARGRRQGREEGREEGQLMGRRQTVLKQLRGKFRGEVTAAVEAQVSQGDGPALDRWEERLLVARTVAEVFVEESLPREN